MPEIEPASTNHDESASENNLFGKYELGRLLGCGAFAKVYYARHAPTGQSVAVKVIGKSKIAGTALAANIKREITIMRRLRHPNIVRIHEVLATKSKIYVVMDFVKGGELFARVAKGRFSEDLSRRFFRQLISAVGYCHSRGIYHRDLKPENLLVDENGDLKVSDFGLSAVDGQIRTDGMLHTMCGTPAYVSPEILARKGYDGAKADVWSCGVILFVLTAGYLPFNDPNLMNMYRKIYKGEFRCPKWMSPDLKRLLSKLLDVNPNKRITVDEIVRDPWFRKGGYKELDFHQEDEFDEEKTDSRVDDQMKLNNCGENEEQGSCSHNLNAFDLISFSAGLDLSGLFDEASSPLEDADRFLSKFSAHTIVEKLEELAKAEGVNVKKGKKKDRVGVELVGRKGNFVAKVEIGQLTEDLIMVEVKRKAGDASLFNELWKKKMRPELESLVYRRDDQHQIIPGV